VRKTIPVFLVGGCLLLGRWIPAGTCVVQSSSAHRGRVARLAGILSATVLVCLIWALMAPAAAGASQPFSAVRAPRQTGLFDVMLSASCTSATACTAVGYRTASTGAVVPLAETWNGKIWSVRAIPTPSGSTDTRLFGISCSTASACIAVGRYIKGPAGLPLAERWNGSRWRVQAAATPTGAKSSVLFAVSCRSATACIAVGDSSDSAGVLTTLAERWNGRHWTIQDTPSPSTTFAQLSGVSCTSATTCTAVGGFENSAHTTLALAEAWNGRRWTIQATPSPAGTFGTIFRSVSCTSAGACTAAGLQEASTANLALAERWDGRRWTIQAIPAPVHNESQLFGVSCSSAAACTAIGYLRDNTGTAHALAAAWDGTKWSIQPIPPASASGSELAGVSCTSPSACTAVGQFSGTSSTKTLAERWNGNSWAIQPTPNPAAPTRANLSR
jgi:hypothetical protein